MVACNVCVWKRSFPHRKWNHWPVLKLDEAVYVSLHANELLKSRDSKFKLAVLRLKINGVSHPEYSGWSVYLQSLKAFKWDKQDMRDPAGEVRKKS